MSDEHARTFTVEEARAILSEVRPFAEQLHEAHAIMDRTHDDVMDSVPTNGGGPAHREFLDASRAASTALDALEAKGVVVRDPANGLLDFPHERDGQVVYLCWRIGEPDIEWWHPSETGFAGRKPITPE